MALRIARLAKQVRGPCETRDTAPLVSSTAAELDGLLLLTWRRARKTLVLLVGASFLAVGAAMLVLPGPGLLVIALALAILATEFYWAKRWLARVQGRLGEVRGGVQAFFDKANRKNG